MERKKAESAESAVISEVMALFRFWTEWKEEKVVRNSKVSSSRSIQTLSQSIE